MDELWDSRASVGSQISKEGGETYSDLLSLVFRGDLGGELYARSSSADDQDRLGSLDLALEVLERLPDVGFGLGSLGDASGNGVARSL